jgi:hypothetical protein
MSDRARSGGRAFARAVIVVTALAGSRADAQVGVPTNSAPNPYRAIENWAKLPDARSWGSTSGVAIDRDGTSVWVAERCSAYAPPSLMKPGTPFACDGSQLDPILKFDAMGKLVKSFGAGLLLFPHGLTVDRDGNVWVTDGLGKDGKGHQVFKFSPEGKVLLTLGKAGVAGSGPDEFNAPSAVVVAPNGDFFVADGHGGNTNARIVKFSSDGKFIKAWGKKGPVPARSTFRTRSRWIRTDVCSWAIGKTTASRFSIRTATISINGRSSAGRVACSSIRMTSSTSQTPNPNPSRRTMTDGSAASGSDA